MIIMRKTFKIYYHHLLPKKFLTNLARFLANSKITWLKNYLILDFLKKHPVNMQEALEENPLAYSCFNDFFTRHLKTTVRTFENARYICPADGAISESGKITHNKLIQAKGIDYSIESLIAESTEACVFMLWGAHAQSKTALIAQAASHKPSTCLVLQANHPSPLSALRGHQPFIGCGHFSKASQWLQSKGSSMDWRLES